MCGIAGILSFCGQPADGREVESMCAAIAHRGPDGEGLHVDKEVGLGHRRLSILDLSAGGAQPMVSSETRMVITYNGEVYNFVEIRRALEARGHTFRGSSDTEVVLAADAEWGRECLDRFNGMWAMAVWDPRRHELFLARDRFGVKPLFYFQNRERLAFASEIKALLRLHDCPRSPNTSRVRDSLHGYPSIERHGETLFEGIMRLEPGCFMVAGAAPPRVTRWWDTWE